jgi:ubiquinone/menaquinone biosynthesis C-methylase UbiE
VPPITSAGVLQQPRVNPDFPDENFVNHFKVYKFAAQFAKGKRVLYVGSGTGYGSDYLANVASTVTGIDNSRQAIRLARKRHSGPNYLLMDAHQLTFGDASFDFILSSENFEHLPRQAIHLQELRRVLAPGGMALIATPNPEVSTGPNKFHFKENTYQELCELLQPLFSEFVILENSLPHNLNRPHRVDPAADPLLILGQRVDKTYLSNTHSFFRFCR